MGDDAIQRRADAAAEFVSGDGNEQGQDTDELAGAMLQHYQKYLLQRN
jgi:hypothetical protein